MKDIVIDGVNLNDLKKRFDAVNKEIAETRKSIRQGASKFIADNIQQGKKLMDEMLDTEDEDNVPDESQVDALAKQAYELLSDARFVSEVAGVHFDLPYYSSQSDYYPDGTPYSNQIDDSENSALEGSDAVLKLYSLVESMESDVDDWNTSYC